MEPQPTPVPNPADAALILSKATYYQVTHTLRGALPAPITDSQEDAARRDIAAIAHVASLLPANPDEANLAAQYVAASALVLDCLRLARQHEDDPVFILKFLARSCSMAREAKGWRLVLLRAQAAREQRETDSVTRSAATQTEHRALGLMAEVLSQPIPAPQPNESPKPDPLAEAERYALNHRKHAALIRRLGHMPDKRDIGWLPPDVVHTIATGTTPTLQALDRKSRAQAAQAV